ncbi:MAG: hypothetical protein ACRCX2_39155 [Paraclostridium sp.]
MSKYYINKESLVGFAFNKIMSRVLPSVSGTESEATNLLVNGLVMKDLGFSYESVKENMPVVNEAQILVSSIVTSLESRVEKFMTKHYEVEVRDGISIESECYRAMIAMEAEDEMEDDNVFESVVTEDNIDEHMENSESGIAFMVANLIKEVVNADAAEVNDIAEKIVTLSKDEADINKEEDISEDDIFSTTDNEEDENKEDPFKDKDGSDDTKDSEPEDEDEDDNPFSSKDKTDDTTKEDDEDGDNPFEDSPEQKTEKNKEDKSNPFDDETDTSSKERAEENANQKLIRELKISTFGLEKLISGPGTFNPFLGLENNSLNRYAKFIADGMYSTGLHSAYTTYGIESQEFKTVKEKYTTLARDVHRAAIATVLVGSLLNVPVQTAKLQSPEVFNI